MGISTLLVGIDEAGYGPILGPLTVSAAGFFVPDGQPAIDLWSALHDSVTSDCSKRDSRIAILDSKVLYRRSDGVRRLERSVLSVLSAWRGLPPTIDGLIETLCPSVHPQLREYPWYRESGVPLPLEADGGGVQIASARLGRDLCNRGIRIAGFWSEVLLEGHYNRLVGNTDNKAVVLLGLTLRLVQRIHEAFPDAVMNVIIDKQGARDHYGRALMRAFDGRRLKIVEEGRDHSVYEMVHARRPPWRVCFRQRGDSRSLPVALASMFSKYQREALMVCFNRFWASNVPGLKSTAGYYQDGLRFLKDIELQIEKLGIARERLVRAR